ncbi:mechanosensitive ion channel domain-containing protein [Marinobacter salicampi]|uniref:mechanosensitive ion channel domain-containing protein n=1 Tax=Marinobacter salicampi TaxID=435907 RepID=UPI001F5F7E16|nr:mechanosensitive ion channel domain-containing protein [Marinobacter salicampi]
MSARLSNRSGLSFASLIGVILLLSMLALQIQAEEAVETPAAETEQAPSDESDQGDSEQEVPLPAVQPDIDEETREPLELDLSEAATSSIAEQIQALEQALDQRLDALEASVERLEYAETLLNRLNDEYDSFELRLEKAGLNLTDEYASLLRQRLDRLQSHGIADSLIVGIRERLSNAREEQLRLEEFEAIIDPSGDVSGQRRQQRAELLRKLHEAVTSHIDVLNEYFNTVATLQERMVAYKELLRQRLFWLPSEATVGSNTFAKLFEAMVWFGSPNHWRSLPDDVTASARERAPSIALVSLVLALLLYKRRKIRAHLVNSGRYVGNVTHDHIGTTFAALGNSFLLALPDVLVLTLLALLLMEGGPFTAALSNGFTAAAVILFLFNFVRKVAFKGGLGESHFRWHAATLAAIRRETPMLMLVLIPLVIIAPTLETPGGADYRSSLGRLIFAVISVTLAVFAHRIMGTVRTARSNSKFLKLLHLLAVLVPLILTVASLLGYHYTAVQLERNVFISICWLALVMLLFYLGLRALAVPERRLTLERLQEQRAAERKMAETREAAESSGEGLPPALEMPEMDLRDISQQSTTLLRIVAFAVAATGLWLLWANVIPALQLFDNITLWTISTGLEDADPLPITLGDLMLALIVIVGTVVAARNLPGTLEITLLSRLHLEPGSGYAITTIITYIIVLLGVMVSLAVIGLQWSKLQWLVAALGVGLGFGLQEIVANFVSGIILLFERPIRVGDTVTIGGTTGTVSRIRIRATTLVDWDRKEQIIPNKTFVTQDLTNWTLSDPIVRVIVKVGVAYGADVDTVQQVLMEVAQGNVRVVDDPAPAVFCVGLGDSSIDFEVRVFIKDLLDYMPLSHELHASMTTALRDAGFQIPFPQRDIHVRTMVDTQSGRRIETRDDDENRSRAPGDEV